MRSKGVEFLATPFLPRDDMQPTATRDATDATDLSWEVRRTQDLVCEVFGAHQWQKARPSVRSMADRPEFCRYHYHEATNMLDEYIAVNLEERGLWHVFHDRDEFDYLMLKVRANVVAFVQSLHAVADTCAHAVYYALALDRTARPLKERDINAAGVLRKLRQHRDAGQVEFAALHALLRDLTNDDGYVYLNALANTSKHRAVVRPALSEDVTGTREQRWVLCLESFAYQGMAYKKIDIRDFMRREHSRIQAITVHIGRSLNDLLSTRLATSSAALRAASTGPACKSGDSQGAQSTEASGDLES